MSAAPRKAKPSEDRDHKLAKLAADILLINKPHDRPPSMFPEDIRSAVLKAQELLKTAQRTEQGTLVVKGEEIDNPFRKDAELSVAKIGEEVGIARQTLGGYIKFLKRDSVTGDEVKQARVGNKYRAYDLWAILTSNPSTRKKILACIGRGLKGKDRRDSKGRLLRKIQI